MKFARISNYKKYKVIIIDLDDDIIFILSLYIVIYILKINNSSLNKLIHF